MQLLVISDWPSGQSEQYMTSPVDAFTRIESGFFDLDGEHYLEADSLTALAQVYSWLAIPIRTLGWPEITPSATELERLRNYQPGWLCYRQGATESNAIGYLCVNPVPQPAKFAPLPASDSEALLTAAAVLLCAQHRQQQQVIKHHVEAAEAQHRTLTSQLASERTARAFAERLAEHQAAEEQRTCWLALAQCRQQVRRLKIMAGAVIVLSMLSWLTLLLLSGS